MKSNFEFLNRYWPALAQIGAAAESYVYSDPNACLYKLGMFGERLILEIFAFEHIKEPTIDNTHANRIRLLKREGLIPKKIDDILYALRKTRNDAVHAGADSVEDAKTLLSMTYNLAIWFMEVYGDWGYIAPTFVMPENVAQPDYEAIIKEQEEKIAALSKQVEAVSTAASSKTSKERAEKGETASESMELSEAETRYLIDEQLRKFGWEADTNNLRYSKGTRPQKGRNLAISEWPTDSTVGKNGYADYALFVGLKLVGIVEAKKAAIDIPSVIDHQCKEYAKGIKAEHKDYVIGQWGAYKVPFVFATNGRKYLKQIETKSGIWCLDLRNGANTPKALQGWISPQGLMGQLEKDIAAANAALQNTPFALQKDTFKNRRTAALLRLNRQGASPGPLFFHAVQRPGLKKAYGPQTIRATAIPTGVSFPHTASLSAGNCHGAEPTLFPALRPAADKRPAVSRGGPPSRRHHNNATFKNKKTACTIKRFSVKYG